MTDAGTRASHFIYQQTILALDRCNDSRYAFGPLVRRVRDAIA
jgi:hypothetical protein